MQITLVQTEIEQALKDFIFSQVKIRQDMDIKIDLRATRGAEGFQAIIDIVPSEHGSTQAPVISTGPVNRSATSITARIAPVEAAAPNNPEQGNLLAELEHNSENQEKRADIVDGTPGDATVAQPSIPEKKALFGNLKNLKSNQQD